MKTLYRRARAANPSLPAAAALAAARRYTAGPLAEYRAALAAWEEQPDKAPGGLAHRPKMPGFYRDPDTAPTAGLRAVEAPRQYDHGYYTSPCCIDTYRPRVWRLSHGRYLAGWEATGNDYYHILDHHAYDDADDAWRAADSMAERDAEREWEYQTRYSEAAAIASDRDTERDNLRDAHTTARDLVATLRELSADARSRPAVCAMLRDCRARMAAALRAIATHTAALADEYSEVYP